MKRPDKSIYDGYERKPESEWTEEDRYNNSLGFVPLTEKGRAAWREDQRKLNPVFDEALRLFEEYEAAKTEEEKLEILKKYAGRPTRKGNEAGGEA